MPPVWRMVIFGFVLSWVVCFLFSGGIWCLSSTWISFTRSFAIPTLYPVSSLRSTNRGSSGMSVPSYDSLSVLTVTLSPVGITKKCSI